MAKYRVLSWITGYLQTITSIWRENVLGYLPADIICSELRGTDNVQRQISEHILKVKQRLLCLLYFEYFSVSNAHSFENWVIRFARAKA